MATDGYLKQAELALAAYANLSNGEPDPRKLNEAGLATAQASEFASHYTVVSSYHDANSSFDATVFSDASGNLTLAIRGTLENIGKRLTIPPC